MCALSRGPVSGNYNSSRAIGPRRTQQYRILLHINSLLTLPSCRMKKKPSREYREMSYDSQRNSRSSSRRRDEGEVYLVLAKYNTPAKMLDSWRIVPRLRGGFSHRVGTSRSSKPRERPFLQILFYRASRNVGSPARGSSAPARRDTPSELLIIPADHVLRAWLFPEFSAPRSRLSARAGNTCWAL